jgi:hypothetical protein
VVEWHITLEIIFFTRDEVIYGASPSEWALSFESYESVMEKNYLWIDPIWAFKSLEEQIGLPSQTLKKAASHNFWLARLKRKDDKIEAKNPPSLHKVLERHGLRWQASHRHQQNGTEGEWYPGTAEGDTLRQIPDHRRMSMLLELDAISMLHNILAGAFTWLLLAGFVSLLGNFTSIVNSHTLQTGAGKATETVIRAAQNLPLLGIAID